MNFNGFQRDEAGRIGGKRSGVVKEEEWLWRNMKHMRWRDARFEKAARVAELMKLNS